MRNANKKLYEEAVERNLLNLERLVHEGRTGPERTKYLGKELAKAKTMLGIRTIDDYWDNRVAKLVKAK